MEQGPTVELCFAHENEIIFKCSVHGYNIHVRTVVWANDERLIWQAPPVLDFHPDTRHAQ